MLIKQTDKILIKKTMWFWLVENDTSWKIGNAEMAQWIDEITNSGLSMPIEILS